MQLPGPDSRGGGGGGEEGWGLRGLLGPRREGPSREGPCQPDARPPGPPGHTAICHFPTFSRHRMNAKLSPPWGLAVTGSFKKVPFGLMALQAPPDRIFWAFIQRNVFSDEGDETIGGSLRYKLRATPRPRSPGEHLRPGPCPRPPRPSAHRAGVAVSTVSGPAPRNQSTGQGGLRSCSCEASCATTTVSCDFCRKFHAFRRGSEGQAAF